MLFQSFTQTDATKARLYGGTGLGLAISKRLVEQMRGHIQVREPQGEGSTFSFEIELPKADSVRPEEGPVCKVLAGLRALVLDDHETNRLILQKTLTAKGLLVETAGRGQEAIRKVADSATTDYPFDVVLLNLHLPDMDGFEVAKRLRERFPIDRLAIMMLTSDNVSGGARRARALGMTAYLLKPVSSAVLMQALLRVCTAPAETAVAGPESHETAEAAPGILFCVNVLVAEDNPVNLTVTEAILRKAGARVTPAINGAEAIELSSRGGTT